MTKKTTPNAAGDREVGENLLWRTEGDKLIITVDLSVKGRPSNSGKSIIVATTAGNKPIAGVIMGVNIYRKE